MDFNSKIFIAGHRGLVGSALVQRFQASGFSRLLLEPRDRLDLTDQTAVLHFFESEKPDYVVVAAARVGGILANSRYQADFLYENLMIQNNILWSAHRTGVKKLLFLGSSCIYPRECPQPMKEEHLLTSPLEPTNEGYAIAKIAGIKLCEKIFEQYGQTFISCMPTNLYGENDHFEPENSHVIPGLITRLYEAKQRKDPEFKIWGTGKALREFMHVDDLADAALWLLQHYDQKPFLNVGTGEEISIGELAQRLKVLIGYEGDLVFDTSKPDGTPRKLLDLTRLHALGWRHRISLEEGLKRTVNHYLQSR